MNFSFQKLLFCVVFLKSKGRDQTQQGKTRLFPRKKRKKREEETGRERERERERAERERARRERAERERERERAAQLRAGRRREVVVLSVQVHTNFQSFLLPLFSWFSLGSTREKRLI